MPVPPRDLSLTLPLRKPFQCAPSANAPWGTFASLHQPRRAPGDTLRTLYLVPIHEAKPVSMLKLHILLLLLLLFLPVGVELQARGHGQVIGDAASTEPSSAWPTASGGWFEANCNTSMRKNRLQAMKSNGDVCFTHWLAELCETRTPAQVRQSPSVSVRAAVCFCATHPSASNPPGQCSKLILHKRQTLG